MHTAERRAVAALWSIRGVGPKTLEAVRRAHGELGPLLDRPASEWVDAVEWRGDCRAQVMAVETLAQRADWLEQRVRALGYQLLFPADAAWPGRLDSIPDPPALLFVRGPAASAAPRRRVAMVGPRSIDLTSQRRLQAIAREAATAGLGVISGAAQGIDTAAHLGALDAKGETWAFMGSALDQLDPGPAKMARAIVECGGTVLSEFPPGFRSNLNSFTRRNRLISGASDAVLVFRAGAKSGSLLTAGFAREQGRPLLVTPGDPWNDSALGSNRLLRDGLARPHLELGDLMRAVGLADVVTGPAPEAFDRDALPAEARQVLDELALGPADFEALLSRLPQLDSGQLSAALCHLEILGAVLHRGGRRYEKH